MKILSRLASVVGFAAIAAFAQGAAPAPITFSRLALHDRFVAEGVAIADINQDGKPDIVAGPDWYEGPDFKVAHAYRAATDGSNHTFSQEKKSYDPENYSDDFLTFAYDFNGDGWIDILVVNTPGEDASWFENPGKKPQYRMNAESGSYAVKGFDNPGPDWVKHLAVPVLNTESPGFLDITGDGRPELIGGTGTKLGYMDFDPKHPNALWTFHAVTPDGRYQRYTHGIGVGDVNGDGRADLLELNGWWENPSVPLPAGATEAMATAGFQVAFAEKTWKFHPQKFGTMGGAQMYAYDVNGDGVNDVISSHFAHGYGLSWWEQKPGAAGAESTWTAHVILSDKAEEKINGVQFSQLHAVLLEDMDGDGLKDIVTGKRYLAHGSTGDVDPLGTPVIYWFKLTRDAQKNVAFTPYLIDDNSGVGTQFAIGDLNGDKKPDVAVVNKHGAVALIQR